MTTPSTWAQISSSRIAYGGHCLFVRDADWPQAGACSSDTQAPAIAHISGGSIPKTDGSVDGDILSMENREFGSHEQVLVAFGDLSLLLKLFGA